MYTVYISLLPSNIREFFSNLDGNMSIQAGDDFGKVAREANTVLAEQTAPLYLGNPGDLGYVDRPVPAMLIAYQTLTHGEYKVWFLHNDHRGRMMISTVTVGDKMGNDIRSTDGRYIVQATDPYCGAGRIPVGVEVYEELRALMSPICPSK